MISFDQILTSIFNAIMIGIGTTIGNYLATRHLIQGMAKLKQKAKKNDETI
jgi:hypothetical protein